MGSMLSLVGHKWGLGRPRGHREGVWKGLGPCWVQIGSSRPFCSNHEGILRPLGVYTTQDANNDPKIIEICSKHSQKSMFSKLPKSQKAMENAGPEANREKLTRNPKHIHLEAILEPFWPHLRVLGRPLGAILGVLRPT